MAMALAAAGSGGARSTPAARIGGIATRPASTAPTESSAWGRAAGAARPVDFTLQSQQAVRRHRPDSRRRSGLRSARRAWRSQACRRGLALEIRLARGARRSEGLRSREGRHPASRPEAPACPRGTAQRATMRGHRSMGGAPTSVGLRVTIWRSSFRRWRSPQLRARHARRGRHSR